MVNIRVALTVQRLAMSDFSVDWDEKRDFRKDLGYWIKMVDAEVVGNIHDKSEQQKDQRSTIICRDFMKKGRE